MALINCPECGKEISDKAASCPNCGYPVKEIENKNDFEPIPQEVARYGVVKCRKCGFSIPANHEYCDNCDEKLDGNLIVERGIEQDFESLDKWENEHLQKALIDGEVIKAIANGTMGFNFGKLVCTNIRIFFINRGMVYGGMQKEINLKHVNSIYLQRKIWFSEIHIKVGGSSLVIQNVKQNIGQGFVEVVNKLLSAL